MFYVKSKRVFYSFWDLHNAFQHGFTEGWSTTTAIFDYLNTVYENVDEGKYVLGLFFDLSNAFDRVDHKILLDKFESLWVRKILNEWVAPYLPETR